MADAKKGTRYYAVYVAGHSFGRMRLGARLRELREAAGISRNDAARIIMKRSADAVRHYETGARLIDPLEHDVLVKHYAQVLADRGLGSSDAILAELTELYTLASKPGEFTTFGLPESIVTYLELERAAKTVRTFENLIIPGLLQVEPYMRRLFQLGKVPANDIDQRARARLKRQERLQSTEGASEPPLRVIAVIGEEGLLRCAREPDAGPPQLAHLAAVATQENVEIRIMRLDGMHAGMDGGFTRLDFPNDLVDPLACLETTSGTQLTDAAAMVKDLDALFDELCGQALDSTKSLALITQLASYKLSRRRSEIETHDSRVADV